MIKTLKLLQHLASLEIYPYLDGEKSKVRDTNKKLTDPLRTQIRESRTAIFDLLSARQNEAVDAVYRLSPMQSGMLFHSQLAPNRGTYIEHTLLHVDDPTFDPARFIEAMQQVINRHDSLRAAFHFGHGHDPVQVIRSQAPLPVTVLEWQKLSSAAYPAQLAALVAQDRQSDFDLTQAPLLRLTVVELGAHHDHRYDLLFTFHHILMDRWSVDLFWAAVQRAYAGLPLSQATPYQAYIHHLRQQPMDTEFWQEYLRGFYAPTPLPGITLPVSRESAQPETQGNIASLMHAFSPTESQQLADFARRQGLTMNALFQAAWAILLARYTNEADVLFGMVTSGRTAPIRGIEAMLGLFINTLPFRVQLEGNPTGLALLQQVAHTQLELQQREHTPLVEVQRWSELPAGTKLFATLLLFQNTPQTAGDNAQRTFRHGRVEPGDTGYPIVALITPASADHPATMMVSYDTTRYAADTMQRLLSHWQQLVLGIVAQPDAPIHTLPLLTETEYQQIVHEWNDTAVDFGPPQTIHALFEQQVARTPDAVAVVMPKSEESKRLGDWEIGQGDPQSLNLSISQSLTYAELNARANQLAHHLIQLGVGADTLVAVAMERSIEMVVSLLAVLKAGGAYVPIDPAYPAERIHFMLQDSAAPILLTHAHLTLAQEMDQGKVQVIAVDQATTWLVPYPTTNPHTQTTPADLAYVIYTSGSTGQPKGVANQHNGVFNRLQWTQAQFRLTSEDRVLQKTPFSFDVSVWEFFWTLMSGACLVVARPEGHKDPTYLCQLIQQAEITLLHFVPSMLRQFLADPDVTGCTSLRAILTSGEALPLDLAQETDQVLPTVELHNLYGPTEAAVDVSHWYYVASSQTVPIGKPIANTTLYVLDNTNHILPVGVAGELTIGGVQLARSYLNRPELTAERFIEHPTFGRLYKTGDLCRWLPDGNIEYLGRTDFQVKIRGFRIELGEIESALLAQEGVREAVVLAREDNPGDKRLVAYIVADKMTRRQDDMVTGLRQALAERLPDYMVPAAFVFLDALPLTPNGKLDRKALPAPTMARSTERSHRPRTALEQRMVAVWEQVLGIYPVGIHDNFFVLGGHSLLAVQLMAKLQPLFQQQLPLRTLFTAPTVAQLAAYVVQVDNGAMATALIPAVVVLQPRGTKPPLICLPGAGGSSLYLYALAQAMGQDRPVYALEARGLDGKTPPFTTVEAIAAYQIARLQQQQPAGPYHLAGHSFGGLVVYEMAQQLHKAGACVGAVMLLDGGAPTGERELLEEIELILLYERLIREEQGFTPILDKAQLQPLTTEERLLCLKASLEAVGIYPPNTPLDQIRGIIQVAAADGQAAGSYLPTDFVRLPLQLFIARDEEREAAATQALIAGWAKYGEVTVQEVPGTHSTLMYAPQVAVLAEQIRACLKTSERE